MATVYRRLTKEWADELANTDTDGIELYWDMASQNFDAVVQGPADSPYENGLFRFEIYLPDDYPFKPPQFLLKTKCWHPNINGTRPHIFCTACIKDNWSSALTVRKLLL